MQDFKEYKTGAKNFKKLEINKNENEDCQF